MVSRHSFAVWCLLIALSCGIQAQSTSPWKKIGDPTFGLNTAPPQGEGYMTVTLRAAAAYQDSNWWTNFVERNRQAVITATLNGTIANIPVTQTVTGKPVTLQKNKSMVDLGFSGTIVDHLPTTFFGMNASIQVNKTAQDGLQNLITQVSTLSTSQPPVLAISSETMQITSLAKNVADFLFKAQLLVTKIQTQNPFPASGALDPGIYVCFAGDQQSDYGRYLQNSQQIKWDGAQLTFSGQPVDKVSYFIIEVNYQSTFFAQPLDALSFGASKPWVTLYLTAENEIPKIDTAAEAASTATDIQSHLSDASTLLSQDYSLINGERDAITAAVYDKLNTEYKDRLTAVGITPTSNPAPAANNPVPPANPTVGQNPPTNPAGPPPLLGANPPLAAPAAPAQPTQAEPPPVIRPNLLLVDPALLATHRLAIQTLGVGRQMVPTATR